MRLSAPARLAYAGLMRGAVLGLPSWYADAERAPSPALVSAWALAVYEAVTNVIRHGYDGGSDEPITLMIEPRPDRVVFTLRDGGRPNTAWPGPSPDDIAEALWAEGGIGMPIIRRIMGETSYLQDDQGRNVLLMVGWI